MHAAAHVWSKDSVWESVLSFHSWLHRLNSGCWASAARDLPQEASSPVLFSILLFLNSVVLLFKVHELIYSVYYPTSYVTEMLEVMASCNSC